MSKQEDVIKMMYCSVDSGSLKINIDSITTTTFGALTEINLNGVLPLTTGDYVSPLVNENTSCWTWWRDYYYPYVIAPSYPVYVREQAQDKGTKAYEIIKMLRDKKIIKIEQVKDFVTAMDELIKIL